MTAARSILVVDDDPGIRVLLMTLLRRAGYRLLEARNGREALAAMRGGGVVDAVIMDLMMPEVSGWEVLRERAADPSLQRIPTIIVTACNLREVAADVAGLDVCSVIGKPFDLSAVLSAVKECLAAPNAPCLAA